MRLQDGAPEAISDISQAAGWNILGCDATSTESQVIRLVCTKPENGCDDLFLGGAQNTIVRLPDDCAAAPFARVVSTQDDEDQSVPDLIMAELFKRDMQPKVLSLEFDYDFGKMSASWVQWLVPTHPLTVLQAWRSDLYDRCNNEPPPTALHPGFSSA